MATINFTNTPRITLPAETRTASDAAIATLENDLVTRLIELRLDDRKVIAKLGDRNVTFMHKASGHMETNPQLLPNYVDPGLVEADLDVVDYLEGVDMALTQVLTLVRDTRLLCRGRAYAGSLAFYKSAKAGATVNAPGAKVVANDLAMQFAIRTPKATPPEESEVPALLLTSSDDPVSAT